MDRAEIAMTKAISLKNDIPKNHSYKKYSYKNIGPKTIGT